MVDLVALNDLFIIDTQMIVHELNELVMWTSGTNGIETTDDRQQKRIFYVKPKIKK